MNFWLRPCCCGQVLSFTVSRRRIEPGSVQTQRLGVQTPAQHGRAFLSAFRHSDAPGHRHLRLDDLTEAI